MSDDSTIIRKMKVLGYKFCKVLNNCIACSKDDKKIIFMCKADMKVLDIELGLPETFRSIQYKSYYDDSYIDFCKFSYELINRFDLIYTVDKKGVYYGIKFSNEEYSIHMRKDSYGTDLIIGNAHYYVEGFFFEKIKNKVLNKYSICIHQFKHCDDISAMMFMFANGNDKVETVLLFSWDDYCYTEEINNRVSILNNDIKDVLDKIEIHIGENGLYGIYDCNIIFNYTIDEVIDKETQASYDIHFTEVDTIGKKFNLDIGKEFKQVNKMLYEYID